VDFRRRHKLGGDGTAGGQLIMAANGALPQNPEIGENVKDLADSGLRMSDVTVLLVASSTGDKAAMDKLLPMVYDELRRLAQSHLRSERPGHTLQSTALVHEAYLRLIDQKQVQWQNRAHFFALASQMIRRILVDHARAHRAGKRGAGAENLSLDEALGVPGRRDLDLIALDDALTSLAALDPQQSRIVELRFFGGLSIEETAAVVGLSVATVNREWASARAWLFRELSR
jgi:RNA polymerase sigma factor (TIGR02999 family)